MGEGGSMAIYKKNKFLILEQLDLCSYCRESTESSCIPYRQFPLLLTSYVGLVFCHE